MKLESKTCLWDIIRPLHSPLTRALRKRLGCNYEAHPEMELPPAYDAVQLDVERHLHNYLHVAREEISQIVIVGCNEAPEISRLSLTYPKASFLCFEPNPNSIKFLTQKYRLLHQVSFSSLALSDTSGKAQFYEMSMSGNGSLLKPDAESWARTLKQSNKSMTSFEVELSTLDCEAVELPVIDLLWMDVQGAEGKVLAGGHETLKRTKTVFTEVTLFSSPYKGAQDFSQINTTLNGFDFTCVGLGLDAWNGTGNAFFVKNYNKLVCM